MSTGFPQNNTIQYRCSSSGDKFKSCVNSNSNDIRLNHGLQKAYRRNLMVNNEGNSLEQHLKDQTKFATLDKKAADPCCIESDDVLASGDFFEPEKTLKRVSQVSLVNDDVIMLVKLPELCWSKSSQIEKVEREEDTEFEMAKQFGEHVSRRDSSNKALKYLCCHRARRISPIREEPEEDEEASNTRTSCTTTSTEVYKTVTKISGKKWKFAMREKKPDPNEQTGAAQAEPNAELQVNRVRIAESSDAVLENIATQVQPEAATANFYNAAIREYVTQDLRGALVTPPEFRLTESGNRGQLLEVSSQTTNFDLNNTKPTKPHRRHIDTLRRWLSKLPFRCRAQASTKSKSQIHAVIHKTYFVRWRKTSPSNDYLNGFGVKPLVVEELPKLRRCRSANF